MEPDVVSSGINIMDILIILIVLGICFFFLSIIGKIAKKRGRSVIGWIIVSIFFSPILAILILLCLGETDERRRERILEEEQLRQSVSRE